MTAPELPDQPVPDKVLEELLAAFAGDTGTTSEAGTDPPTYDFDDPSIDRLLGIDPSTLTGATDLGDQPADPPAEPVTAPTLALGAAGAAPAGRPVVDLTGVGDPPDVPAAARSPMPTGSTRREARAAARADAKAVKAARAEAEKSAKATLQQAERDA